MEKGEAIEALSKSLAGLDMQQEKQFLPPEESSRPGRVDRPGWCRRQVAAFNRSHGEVRLMGPGRMERDEPWLDPVSPLEALWYRGFLYRAFDETVEGMLEFYYLPQELLVQFPEAFNDDVEETPELLRPADQPDGAPIKGATNAVDDLTTLLAVALRLSVSEDGRIDLHHWLLDSRS